jgi:hypothetical protein
VAVFTATDAAVLAGILFLIWPAWFVPERHWPALARVLSPLAVGYLSPNRKTTGGKIGGFSAPGGSATKLRMLEFEGVHVERPRSIQQAEGAPLLEWRAATRQPETR